VVEAICTVFVEFVGVPAEVDVVVTLGYIIAAIVVATVDATGVVVAVVVVAAVVAAVVVAFRLGGGV
jgi:hypothetical protein